MTLYFAYGSNLKLERMRRRVPSARVEGRARLPGHRLGFDKRGGDGSGKANLVRDAVGEVWGVVYAIDPDHWPRLDGYEPGYERVTVEVHREQGAVLRAFTYEARLLTRTPVPADWYLRLILEGGREHGLPEAYLAAVEALADLGAARDPE